MNKKAQATRAPRQAATICGLALAAISVVACPGRHLKQTRPPDAPSTVVDIADLNLACLSFEPSETLLLPKVDRSSVNGQISSDGGPLPGVAVFLEDTKDSSRAFLAMTDDDGSFSFSGIPQGDFRLWTCKSGWNVVLIPLRVTPKGTELSIRIDLPLSF